MTNDPQDCVQYLIDGPSLGGWVTLAVGWPLLLSGGMLLVINAWRQTIILRRIERMAASERLSAIGLAGGWVSFMVGIAMAWYSLYSVWVAGASLGGFDESMLLICYAQSSVPAFIGILTLSGSFFEASLFKYLWMKKMNTAHKKPN